MNFINLCPYDVHIMDGFQNITIYPTQSQAFLGHPNGFTRQDAERTNIPIPSGSTIIVTPHIGHLIVSTGVNKLFPNANSLSVYSPTSGQKSRDFNKHLKF